MIVWRTATEQRKLRTWPGLCPHDPPHMGNCPDVDTFDFRPSPRTWKRPYLRLFGRWLPVGKWRPA